MPMRVAITVLLAGAPIARNVFERDFIRIGRAPTSDVFLDDPAVDRMHAVIESGGDSMKLIALDSENNDWGANGFGVHRDGEKLSNYTVINDSDVLTIGPFTLRIDVEPRGALDPASIPPTEAPLPLPEDDEATEGAVELATTVLDILVPPAQREAVKVRLRSLEAQAWDARRRHEQAVTDFNRAMDDHIDPHLKLN